MLTHPKPEDPEPPATSSQRDGAQDGTGKTRVLGKYQGPVVRNWDSVSFNRRKNA